MLLNDLFSVLNGYHPISTALQKCLTQNLQTITLPCGHLLLEPGKVARHAYFLASGHAFTYRYHREEIFIERFWHPHDILFSADSFFDQTPAEEFMELLTTAELLQFPYEVVRKILVDFPEADVIYRLVMRDHYRHCRTRLEDHLFLTAAQRYEKLHTRFAMVEQLLPQEQVACYLGIVPQSLSRIKKQLTTTPKKF